MRGTRRTAAIAAMIVVGCLAATVLAGAWVLRGEGADRAATADRVFDPVANNRPGTSGSDDVVTFSGIADVKFGDTVADLTVEHGLTKQPGACVMRFGDLAGVDPVFVEDRLVLLWAHAPVRTPEGISEGSPVDAVRRAYSGEVELTPPAGSHAYPGIMVKQGDSAYLFLHDGTTVRKEIAGYADYVQRLYTDDFGAC
ncbi:hypothetical protein HDA40_001036 [Hamadaea flava]|uniref:Uncharacterized protein n=1 Tax=Hamadaea flava TaxID=1742688 RepID=A0ABV8LQX8_9ACTN|nr:hypothetical protein [Hamadaea flava]MCP2322529.1 hypothetical protein [Hamadaea flava]